MGIVNHKLVGLLSRKRCVSLEPLELGGAWVTFGFNGEDDVLASLQDLWIGLLGDDRCGCVCVCVCVCGGGGGGGGGGG